MTPDKIFKLNYSER